MTDDLRYRVYDSQATAAYPRNTPINPRYWIIDAEKGNEVVDQFVSKRAATLTARDLNASR